MPVLAAHRHDRGSKAFPLRARYDGIHALHVQEADVRSAARLHDHVHKILQKLQGRSRGLQKHGGTGRRGWLTCS